MKDVEGGKTLLFPRAVEGGDGPRGRTLPEYELDVGPRYLFGRAAERRWLEESLETAAAARRPVVRLVAGYSGVGKTSLIEELGATARQRGGHFATGAFDSRSRAAPYSAVLAALRDLVRQKLDEKPERVRVWTRRLTDRLGRQLGVVAEVLPELLSLVGEPPPLPRVPPENNRSRFYACVSRTLTTFVDDATSSERAPLVIFLDDLQWIDSASVELLVSLLSAETETLLLVGAYRDHEVDAGHLLSHTVAELVDRDVDVDTLRLMPLSATALGQLLAETLGLPRPEVAPLAELVYRKTAGNPFFAKTFLSSLYQGRLLRLAAAAAPDDGSPRWTWDLEQIAALEATDNIVELVARQLDVLPPDTRRALATAAVLGREIEAPVLTTILAASEPQATPWSSDQTERILTEACRRGLLSELDAAPGDVAAPRYAFAHDRVREGAFELFDVAQRAEVHLRIGRLLRDRKGPRQAGPRRAGPRRDVFEIVDHLNHAIHLIMDPQERSQLARLGAEAGRRARASGAFPAALTYLQRALRLLADEAAERGGDPWQESYELTRALHAEAAEAAAVAGDFEIAEALCDALERHARSPLDAMPAHETRIYVLFARRQGQAALSLALDVLAGFGVEMPLHPKASDLRAAVQTADRAVETVLASAEKQGVGGLPAMRDPEHLAVARLLMRTALVTAWTPSRLFRLASCRLAELVAARGIGPVSPFAYVLMAEVRCSELEDFAAGRRLGQLALELADLPDWSGLKPTCQAMFEILISTRSVHPAEIAERFAGLFRQCMEVGDLWMATGLGYQGSLAGMISGRELTRVESSARGVHAEIRGIGQQMMADVIEEVARFIGMLLGRWPVDRRSDLDYTDPESTTGFRLRVIGPEMMTRCLMRDPGALETARESLAMLGNMLPVFPFDFYRCLLFLDHGEPDDPGLDVGLERLEKQARIAPDIYQHKMDLVLARRQQAVGRVEQALSLYHRAIQGAAGGGFLPEQALAGELAAELYLERGRERDAATHMRDALTTYRRWGARAKVDQLVERFSDLLATPLNPAADGSTPDQGSTPARGSVAFRNARLYQSLRQEIETRRRAETDLRQALDEVAVLKERLEAENVYLRQEIQSHFEEIVGDSEPMRKVLYNVEQVAATDATVLILGETGTGKELIARALHRLSPRSERPLVKVNCAALPTTLIESELFGHEKGAFTGALSRKAGRFELADSGTLFLDEIGDLPLELQAKLLRVLQEGEYERLGGARTMKVDVRIIAATNRNLEQAMADGTFRSDLFYRLTVFPIELPPLRERRGDVRLLVRHFIDRKRAKVGSRVEKVPRQVMERLAAYRWPGNVRELENVVERALILSPGTALQLEDAFAPAKPRTEAPERLDDLERIHIRKILELCDWKIKGQGNAAERLGIAPATLRGRMRKLGLRRPDA